MGNSQDKPRIRYDKGDKQYHLSKNNAKILCSKVEDFTLVISKTMQPILDDSILKLLNKTNVIDDEILNEFKEVQKKYISTKNQYSSKKLEGLDSSFVEILEEEMKINILDEEFYYVLNTTTGFFNHYNFIKKLREEFEDYLVNDQILDLIYDRFIKLHSQNVDKESYLEDFKQVLKMIINRFVKSNAGGNPKYNTLLWKFILTLQRPTLKPISVLASKLLSMDEFLQQGILFVKDYTQLRMVNYNKSSIQPLNKSKSKKKDKPNSWNPVQTSLIYMQSQIISQKQLSFFNLDNDNMSTLMGFAGNGNPNSSKKNKNSLKKKETNLDNGINLNPFGPQKQQSSQEKDNEKSLLTKVTFSNQFRAAESQVGNQIKFQQGNSEQIKANQLVQSGNDQGIQHSFTYQFSQLAKEKDAQDSIIQSSQHQNKGKMIEEEAKQKKIHSQYNSNTDFQTSFIDETPVINELPNSYQNTNKIFPDDHPTEIKQINVNNNIQNSNKSRNKYFSSDQNNEEEIKFTRNFTDSSTLQIKGIPQSSIHGGVGVTDGLAGHQQNENNTQTSNNHLFTTDFGTPSKRVDESERLKEGLNNQQSQKNRNAGQRSNEKISQQYQITNGKGISLGKQTQGINSEEIKLNWGN